MALEGIPRFGCPAVVGKKADAQGGALKKEGSVGKEFTKEGSIGALPVSWSSSRLLPSHTYQMAQL